MNFKIYHFAKFLMSYNYQEYWPFALDSPGFKSGFDYTRGCLPCYIMISNIWTNERIKFPIIKGSFSVMKHNYAYANLGLKIYIYLNPMTLHISLWGRTFSTENKANCIKQPSITELSQVSTLNF